MLAKSVLAHEIYSKNFQRLSLVFKREQSSDPFGKTVITRLKYGLSKNEWLYNNP